MPTVSTPYTQFELRNILPSKQLEQKIFVDNFIADYTKIPVEKICSNRRDAHIVRARWMAWYLLREEFNFYVATIGRAYERDHTTVISGLRKAEEYFGMEFLKSLGNSALSTYSQA